MSKHVQTDIGEGTSDYSFDDAKIAKESATDGVFVIRTSLPRTDRSSAQLSSAQLRWC
ncbi:MAG: hypothetical protein V3V08_01155 [Nannocystaceae bacterium]